MELAARGSSCCEWRRTILILCSPLRRFISLTSALDNSGVSVYRMLPQTETIPQKMIPCHLPLQLVKDFQPINLVHRTMGTGSGLPSTHQFPGFLSGHKTNSGNRNNRPNHSPCIQRHKPPTHSLCALGCGHGNTALQCLCTLCFREVAAHHTVFLQ